MAITNAQLMAETLRQRPQIQYPTGGGTVPRQSDRIFGQNQQQAQQPQQYQQPSLGQMQQNGQMMDKFRGMFGGGGGATAAAGEAAMPAMSAGGGSSLGTMGLQQGAVSFPGAASAGGGGAAGGGLGAAAGTAGMGAGLIGGALLADNQMNEKDGMFNADKMNSWGSRNGIGLRAGDLVNGFNPATWASDPKKAAKGLGNAFTFGLLDKII